MVSGSTLCVDPQKCKWLIVTTNKEKRNQCGCYYECPEINNVACDCPAVEHARAYEIALRKTT